MIDVHPVRPSTRTAQPDAAEGRRRWRPSVIGCAVFAVIIVMTGALSWFARSESDSNETRLLRLQTRQTGILLQSFVGSLQTPLASAAEIAASTGGGSSSYLSYASAFLRKQARFVSVTLWREQPGQRPVLIDTTGQRPRLESSTARRNAFLQRVGRSDQVGVIGFLSGPKRHLGYGFASSQHGRRYVVYAEDVLPPTYRRSTPQSSPFADLRFALYLGNRRSPSTLLATSESHLPLTGRTAQIRIAFGTSSLTLVAAPIGVLGGRFADSRWWLIALLGGIVALGAGLASDRLVKRRRSAEALARENEELLLGQRTIAESLQQALMPKGLPPVPGLEIAARYFPGVNGIHIGGDWYDVIELDDRRFFFVVGDVSGRGLEAGSIMASLHFAIRGFVHEGHDPATVLSLLTRLLDIGRDKHFATVVCGLVDVAQHTVTIANAGHLPPLLVTGNTSTLLSTALGPPIGVRASYRYESVTIQMPEGSALLAYTDGLVERRGETIDDGLRRLQDTVHGTDEDLEQMLTALMSDLTPDGADDDTAVLGFRWSGETAAPTEGATRAAPGGTYEGSTQALATLS